MKVYSYNLLLSFCSMAPVHAYRANSILSISRRYGGKKLLWPGERRDCEAVHNRLRQVKHKLRRRYMIARRLFM